MEIKLQRLGGLLPVRREATANINCSEEELQQLLKSIRKDEKKIDTRARDMTSDYLEINGTAVPVDLRKTPPEFKETFEELKANLKPVKP